MCVHTCTCVYDNIASAPENHVCVCVCVCVCIYIHTHTNKQTNTCIYAHIYVKDVNSAGDMCLDPAVPHACDARERVI